VLRAASGTSDYAESALAVLCSYSSSSSVMVFVQLLIMSLS
jgi:hypothetical protein